MKKPIAYVIGPFRAKTEYEKERNVYVAEKLALALWSEGFIVYCPHLNTRKFQGMLKDKVWMDGHMRFLELADVACLCGSWRASKGSIKEVEKCQKLKIPYFQYFDEIVSWKAEWDKKHVTSRRSKRIQQI